MSSSGRRSGKSCRVWVGSNPTPVLYRGSQYSREFRGLRRQLRKALISGCSQRRTLAQASGTQSRSIGVDAPTKGGRHLVTRLPLMVWMPHRAIDQPQMQRVRRSEEHTSELQSRRDLVCRLLLEKKKK